VKHWSIQARLTLWYGAALAVSLVLLGTGVWWTLQTSLFRDVDQRLLYHATETSQIVNREMAENQHGEASQEIREALSAARGELTVVCDAKGAIIYSAPELNGSCPSAGFGYSNLQLRGEPFRSLLLRSGPYTIYTATSTRHIHEAIDRLRWILFLSMPLVLVAASAGGYWMSVRAMAPVEEITTRARRIGLQNLSQRLPVSKTGDALERLSETLNEMLARLESSFQRISRFTADAAHELRTPLALIRVMAEVAVRSRRPEECQEALPQIIEETDRTSRLVENLLFLARADFGAELPTYVPFQLDAVLLDVIESAKKLAAARDIELIAPVRYPSLQARGDPTAMRRLLLILLDNAIKYTPSGGRVTVALNDSTVEIIDTGIGISAEDLPHIFERFYRADKARSRDIGGAGLGLSLAKWIAEAHGATITAESNPGGGSKFILHLPAT
jgi:heavy metal sensor kinase